MAENLSNQQRISEGLRVFQKAFQPYVLTGIRGHFGQDWWRSGVESAVERKRVQEAKLKGNNADEWFDNFDLNSLVFIATRYWEPIFKARVNEVGAKQNLYTVKDIRNRWSHRGANDAPAKQVAHDLQSISLALQAIGDKTAAQQVETLIAGLEASSSAKAETLAAPEQTGQAKPLLPSWFLVTVAVAVLALAGFYTLPSLIQWFKNQGIQPDFAIASPPHEQRFNGAGVTFVPKVLDPDKQVRSYFWNFGDGETSADITPTHVYNKTGDYTVSLIVQGAGFTTIPQQITIHIDDLISDRTCSADKTLPRLVKNENPVIILTREEDFIVHNELFKGLDEAGFVSVEPRLLANIAESPKVMGAYRLDCDSMASLGTYLKSYILIAPQLFTQSTGTNSQGQPLVEATVQVVAYNPQNGQELFRDAASVVRYWSTLDGAQREAAKQASALLASQLANKLSVYYP